MKKISCLHFVMRHFSRSFVSYRILRYNAPALVNPTLPLDISEGSSVHAISKNVSILKWGPDMTETPRTIVIINKFFCNFEYKTIILNLPRSVDYH